MKEAWALTKGAAYGKLRTNLNRQASWARDTVAERRRMFRFFLSDVWAKAKRHAAEAARRAAEAAAWVAAPVVTAPRPMTPAEVELLSLECKDRWTQADFRRAQELRLAA